MATLAQLPNDVLCCIGSCLARTDAPLTTVARDCASAAMSCKALSPLATAAWKRCAVIAECQPGLCSLARAWACISRGANREHTFKIVRNLPTSHSRINVEGIRRLLDQQGRVGASCPIPTKAAAFILDVSWLPIHRSVAEKRFWDRDLAGCEQMTTTTLRYRSVIAAPLLPSIALAGSQVARRVDDLQALDAKLHAHGIERQWGETSTRMQQVAMMDVWARDVGLLPGLRASMDAHLRAHGTFDAQMQEDAVEYARLLAEFDCDAEPLPDGSMHTGVMRGLSNGIQTRRLGRVMFAPRCVFPRVRTMLRRQDVVALDATITLVCECQAAADSEMLDKYTTTGNLEAYLTGMSNDNRIRRCIDEVVADCRQLGAHQALEFTAVALLRTNWDGDTVRRELEIAHGIVATHPTEFRSTVTLGDIGLELYAIDAACNAVDAWAAEKLGVSRGTPHFGIVIPMTADGVERYSLEVRQEVQRALLIEPGIRLLCFAPGVNLHGDKMRAWVQTMALPEMPATMEELRDTFPALAVHADGHAQAESAVRTYNWLLANTELEEDDLKPLINVLGPLAAHWALEANVGKAFYDLTPSHSMAHFELVKARHNTFLAQHPAFTHAAKRSFLTVRPGTDLTNVPDTLKPWVVTTNLDFEGAMAEFNGGRDLNWISMRTTHDIVQQLVVSMTSEADRAWLNRVQGKPTSGRQYDARLRRHLATNSPGTVPTAFQTVFRHLFTPSSNSLA